MAKFHHLCMDRVEFPNSKNPKNGMYYCYEANVFDKLLHDKEFVKENDAFDEYSWIIDNLDNMLESNNKTFVFIPTVEVSTKIQNYFAELDTIDAL